tara:strand:+ start:288 stop:497 length:210 start_codon:yes stop_codon:yes gene_type:complete
MKTYTIQDENGDVWNGEEMRAARGSVYEIETLTEAIQIAGRVDSACVMEWDSVAELGYQVWPERKGAAA